MNSLIKNAGKEVTCLRGFGGEGDSVVAVAGRDGKVELWDFRSGSGSKVGEVRSGEFVLYLSEQEAIFPLFQIEESGLGSFQGTKLGVVTCES